MPQKKITKCQESHSLDRAGIAEAALLKFWGILCVRVMGVLGFRLGLSSL